MIDRVSMHHPGQVKTGTNVQRTNAQSFGDVFSQELQKAQQGAKPRQQVAFSKHAMERAEQRGIAVTPSLMDRLNESVEKAEAKGSKNILAFDAVQAFIINVPNHRVITTMSQDEMKENVFTNIDGAVLL